jgi:CubicO group peptidase (beta-lactamase class C family)
LLTSKSIAPGNTWATIHPHDTGMDVSKLKRVTTWLDDNVRDPRFQNYKERHPGETYRLVIVRGGRIVAEWNHGVERSARLRIWSATKSVYSCILGILIEQGVIESADSHVRDYYPEAMDVPDGAGPKPGRHVTDKDHAITLRQLITNTSGYMKPGEHPGQVFHYQTYGMNILVHAMETACGLYDSKEPESSATLHVLINKHLKTPLQADWDYYTYNFDLQASARLNIFGNFLGMSSTALDMARLGWLWRNFGEWNGKQLIPRQWLIDGTRTAPDILANCPEEDWRYGHGFWTNDHLKMWPSLPSDAFAAAGAGQHHIWVCPSLDLVIVQSPGLYEDQHEHDNPVLPLIVDACR